MRKSIFCALGAAAIVCQTARAGITTYGNGDRDAWFEDVGASSAITTIGFDDWDTSTIITTQYQHFGITFTSGTDRTRSSNDVFPRDGWGLDNFVAIEAEFDEPIQAIASDFPGGIQMDLFLNEDFVGSAVFIQGGADVFGGIVSSIPFNRIVLTDPIVAIASIDDLHFTTIPTPGSLVISLVVFGSWRIRRRPGSH